MNVPRQPPRKLTYADYVLFPDDGRRHEIIEGEHHVNPAPGTGHQTVSRHIQFQLYSQLEQAGIALVFDAPTDLQLSDSDVVQPDLIVVATAKRFIITPTKVKGVPDLVVEILSSSTEATDRGLKRASQSPATIRDAIGRSVPRASGCGAGDGSSGTAGWSQRAGQVRPLRMRTPPRSMIVAGH